jgi:hypothetical protein
MLVTWFTIESVTLSSRQLYPTNTPARQQRVMSQQRKVQKSYNEGGIYLAISDIKLKRVLSEKRAAEIYNVPRTTI